MNTGFGPSRPGHGADDVLIGDRPQPADDAEVVGRFQRQRPAHGRVELALHRASSSGYRPKTWLRFMAVARNSFRRSAFGPDSVSSCG